MTPSSLPEAPQRLRHALAGPPPPERRRPTQAPRRVRPGLSGDLPELAPAWSRRDFLLGALRERSDSAPRAPRVGESIVDSPRAETTLPPLSVIAYNRLAFGPRPEDWAAWQALGANDDARFDAYVTQQLNPAGIDDSACDARLAAAGFTTLQKSLAQLWEDHVTNNPNDYSLYVLPADETYHATWLRAIYSKRQLLEVLADFWHNHFNAYAYSEAAPVWVHYDRDVIRGHALGNFRQFLEAVGSSTAMLFYLDNIYSSDGGPNENYARELFELHAMGADNYYGPMDQTQVPLDPQGRPVGYVDEDVYEAARAFTGWTVNGTHWELPPYVPGPPPQYVPGTFLAWDDWHDRFQKYILRTRLPSNQSPLADGRKVYDLLANHPATARHVCTKLCRRLIGDTPPESVVESAATVWLANTEAPDQLKRVVEAIVRSQAFKTTWGEKIKRPFELAASTLRATAAQWRPDWDWNFYWVYSTMGQRLFEWPAPNGHPDLRTAWSSTNVMLRRWNFATAVLDNWLAPAVQVDLLDQMPASVRTPNQIATWWTQRILGRAMAADDRREIVDFLAQGRNPDFDLPPDELQDRTPVAVQLICMAPDFQYR